MADSLASNISNLTDNLPTAPRVEQGVRRGLGGAWNALKGLGNQASSLFSDPGLEAGKAVNRAGNSAVKTLANAGSNIARAGAALFTVGRSETVLKALGFFKKHYKIYTLIAAIGVATLLGLAYQVYLHPTMLVNNSVDFAIDVASDAAGDCWSDAGKTALNIFTFNPFGAAEDGNKLADCIKDSATQGIVESATGD